MNDEEKKQKEARTVAKQIKRATLSKDYKKLKRVVLREMTGCPSRKEVNHAKA